MESKEVAATPSGGGNTNNSANTASGSGARKKSSSAKKQHRKHNAATLEEVKKHGRLLRSSGKRPDVDFTGLMEGLTLEELEKQPKGVILVYEEFQAQHCCQWDQGYPERPERITLPWQRCQELGLVDRCWWYPVRECTDEDILSQHHPDLMRLIDSSATADQEERMRLSAKFDNVFFHPTTSKAARISVDAAKQVVEQIIQQKVRCGMAIVRPPGHHAMHNEACGYCFYNNVAIAAKHAFEQHNLHRVLIVDWDVHHGQATQYMFYDDPRVLYFSIHRYEFGTFWPNLRESDYDHIGSGDGTGFNINIPLNKTGMGNGDYMAILQQVLLPVAYEFNPELVMVSSGYDAAVGCPEGEMAVTPACYAHFINLLKPLAQGKLAVILEGGYCLKSLSEGVALTLRALLDDPCPDIGPLPPPCDSVVNTIVHVQEALRPHWKCFQFQQGAEVWEDNEPRPEKVSFQTEENKPKEYPIRDCYPVQTAEVVAALDRRIDLLINNTNLSKPPNRTCLVYDEKMRSHKSFTSHSHPERPDRITRIYSKLQICGLVDRCKQLESRYATEEEISLVHKIEYVQALKRMMELEEEEMAQKERFFNSIYLSPKAYDCARLAAGSTLAVVDEVLSGHSQNGVAIVRPPGHHAEQDVCSGFCFFNSVAIAAKYAISTFGLKRVLVLDWDVHHGNGIQHMFETDPRVLYISLHRYDNGFFYPGDPDADLDRVGKGEGEGFNVNIPFNKVSMGTDEYVAAFQQIVMPVAYEYNPELVLISAGFDAALGDPLGGYRVTPDGYAHMTQMLLGLANGRLIAVLEGGYNLNSISESMAACTSVMLGDACPPMDPLHCNKWAARSIMDVLDVQKKYWKSLRFRVRLPGTCETPEEEKPAPEKSSQPSEMSVEELAKRLEIFQVKDEASASPPLAPTEPSQPPPEGAAGAGDVGTEAEQELGACGGAGGGETAAGEELGACGGAAPGPTIADLLAGQAQQGLDTREMYAVVPLPWCPHLEESVQPLPPGGLDVNRPCQDCGHVGENWVCLTCYQVHCGRYVNEHMLYHGLETEHRVVLSYADLSVWCYGCDHYVHHESILPAKRAAHISKFNEDIPG